MGQYWSAENGSEMNSSPIDGSLSAARHDFDFPKLQLHYHLDGGLRYTTILELAQNKKIDLQGAKTVAELKKVLVTRKPATLADVLKAFAVFLPTVAGDLEAIERVAYEACEDQAKDGVIYFEGRYSPHFFAGMSLNTQHPVNVAPAEVVKAVHRGFVRGEKEFGIKARSILCCIRSHDGWNKEVITLCETMKEYGVVAIDVAGCAGGADEKYEQSVIDAFKQAYKVGIHRTVHAGEASGAKTVVRAVDDMHAERIGHGYHLLDDPAEYTRLAVEGRLHLEACPLSSVMTSSVPLEWPKHPIIKWANDDVNFSLSTDDPTVFDNSVQSELQLVHGRVGLMCHQIWKCQLNAAESCFLEEPFKSELIKRVKDKEPK
ncbi:unnamed protein product [Bursaphelenchus okinawaensis]|uniref:Adenosine deaminase n=1 Tax=Bursaphelenchus okinawaensis TaxID=465554 RepID=A0A811L0U9_9BILA|nr:unnamed protein product [Bursaphelenchus okinawaensis]CAG9114715.1 unnamed protein product [Bursaphelenchus okinawaensis]